MGIKDRLTGKFDSLPPFADALSAGIQDELKPVFDRMNALQQAITQLGGQVASAQSAADGAASAAAAAAAAAAKAAEDAAKAAQPTPTPSASTTGGTTGGTTTPTTTPGVTPPITPTPSASTRPSLFVLALPNPIFIGDILSGNTRPPASIGISPREGAFYVGSLMDLTLSNIDNTVEFVNWTNAAGSVLGTSPSLTVEINEANASITANFRDKPTTTGGTSTTGTTGGSTTSGGGSGGGGGSLGDETGGSIEERNRI